uniref:Interleukin-15 receptor subunit alpha n=1 Tax=Pogona vitticeps TaxID=103695 RepID=A0ABM5GLM9_9SAUR
MGRPRRRRSPPGLKAGSPPAGRPKWRRLFLLLLLLSALLGLLPCRPAEAASPSAPPPPEGQCGSPPPMANAHIAEGATGTRLRYSCAKNYKRQAGTSSLVVCKYNEMSKKPEWTRPNINCIRDPSLPPEPETATEDSGRETEASTPNSPEAAGVDPSVTSAHPYESRTDPSPSPPGTAGVTSGPTTATAGFAEDGEGTPPGEATERVTPSHGSATPVSRARTSKTLTAGSSPTVVPSEGTVGNTTRASDPASPESRKGTDSSLYRQQKWPPYGGSLLDDFLYFSIGFPALAVGFIVICSLLWCLYRRKRGTVVGPHTEESIPMAPVTSREEGSSFSPLDDPEPSGEGAPMLRIHHAAPTSLAHHQASANRDGDGSS